MSSDRSFAARKSDFDMKSVIAAFGVEKCALITSIEIGNIAHPHGFMHCEMVQTFEGQMADIQAFPALR
jgi:hypothetical protein